MPPMKARKTSEANRLKEMAIRVVAAFGSDNILKKLNIYLLIKSIIMQTTPGLIIQFPKSKVIPVILIIEYVFVMQLNAVLTPMPITYMLIP